MDTAISGLKPFDVETEMDGSGDEAAGLVPPEGQEVLTTVSEVIDEAGFGWFQVLLMAYTGCAWAADACEIMLLSYLAPAAECEFGLSSAQVSSLSSAVFVGIALGAWIWSPVADWLGRKKGFLATGLFTCVFAIASALAPNFLSLLIFRTLVGFGLGGVPVIYSLFTEFVPTRTRGLALVGIQAFWTLGTLGETGLIALTLPTLGWRWMVALSALPFLIIMLGYPWLPESPMWLTTVKRDKVAAMDVLKKVVGMSRRTTPMPPIALSIPQEPAGMGPPSRRSSVQKYLKELSTLFRWPLVRVTVCMSVIWFANSLVYYGLVLLTTKLSTTEGGSSELQCVDGAPVISTESYLEVIIVTTAELPGLILAALLVDVVGRKPCLYVGLTACGAAVMALMLLPPQWLTMALLWISRALIMTTFTVAWIFTPEAYPTPVRASGTGFSNGWARVGGIVAPVLSNSLVDAGKLWLTELLFGLFSLLGAAAALLAGPETKGKKLG